MQVCKSDSLQSLIRELDPRDIEIMKLGGRFRARVGERERDEKKYDVAAKTKRSEGRRRGNRPQHTRIHAVLSFFRRFCLPAPANHKIANASRTFVHMLESYSWRNIPPSVRSPLLYEYEIVFQGRPSLIMNYLNLINKESHLQAIRKLLGNTRLKYLIQGLKEINLEL